MVTTTIVEYCDILMGSMGSSLDNHNMLVRWIIIMSFGNRYYECSDVR